MISLKIKTLDSQDHDFTVEDDVSVRQLKCKQKFSWNIRVVSVLIRKTFCYKMFPDNCAPV